MYGMLPVPLTMSWCATWFALSRHGGLSVVGSFDSFLIVFHALRLLCQIGGRDDFLPSPLLSLRHSDNQFVSRFYGAASKGLLKYLLLYASYRLFDWEVILGTCSVQHPLDMRLLDASNMS